MASKVLAREVNSANDIRSEEEVVVGWDTSGNKFAIIENFLDTRIHVLTRHFILSLDGSDTQDYSIEIKRVVEGMSLVQTCRAFMEEGTRLWAFPSANYAMSWFMDTKDNVIRSDPRK